MADYKVTHRKAESFHKIYHRKPELKHQTHYCPGCGHGIANKLLARAIDEAGIQDRTVMISPVGCSVFLDCYFDVGHVQGSHGRAPAVGTGLTRSLPGKIVISYQGDGDLAAIGSAEILHAANRGESMMVIFVNNGIYGMTGGQMAPTTLVGQVTTSSPKGRDVLTTGYPLPVTELLSLLPGVAYAARGSVADPGHVGKTKAMIRRAFDVQVEGHGFAIVEVLSTCPVGWGMTPTEAMHHLETETMAAYPVGLFVDRARGVGQTLPAPVGKPATRTAGTVEA